MSLSARYVFSRNWTYRESLYIGLLLLKAANCPNQIQFSFKIPWLVSKINYLVEVEHFSFHSVQWVKEAISLFDIDIEFDKVLYDQQEIYFREEIF